MADSGMKGRVRGLLGGPPPGTDPLDQLDPNSTPTPEASAQHQALQVLTLAQRTAEDHVASARRQADKITAEARATADQIVRDAQTKAQALQQDAEKVLADAHTSAAQIAREAQARADKAQRNAEEILSEARTRADAMAKNAQANADELKHQAQQRYDDVVGGLASKREALQQQIEALEQFDHDYRTRLTKYLQAQLRSLWVDQPHVDAEVIDAPEEVVASALPPAQRGRGEGS